MLARTLMRTHMCETISTAQATRVYEWPHLERRIFLALDWRHKTLRSDNIWEYGDLFYCGHLLLFSWNIYWINAA